MILRDIKMDRFDKNFHDVDAQTSRPFSAGHPDGVWIASILYSLPIVVLFIGFLISIALTIVSGSPGWQIVFGMVIGLAGLLTMFLPIVILLFKRSRKAFVYSLFLCALCACVCAVSYFAQPDQLLIPSVILLIQLFGAFYFWGLKKDELLK